MVLYCIRLIIIKLKYPHSLFMIRPYKPSFLTVILTPPPDLSFEITNIQCCSPFWYDLVIHHILSHKVWCWVHSPRVQTNKQGPSVRVIVISSDHKHNSLSMAGTLINTLVLNQHHMSLYCIRLAPNIHTLGSCQELRV